MESLAIGFYCVATWLQSRVFFKRVQLTPALISVFAWPAICFHTMLLYFWIDGHGAQNLSMANIFALIMWLSALLLTGLLYTKPVANLMMIIFPLASVSIYIAAASERTASHIFAVNTLQVIHVWLAIFAFSLLLLASVQALLIAWQERQIRSKTFIQLFHHFPAVTVMENLLFELLMLGFIFLTLLLVTSFLSFNTLAFAVATKKIIFSVVSWCVFAGLLWGRHRYGWRAQTAVSWTLSGMLFLILSYFGAQM